MLFKLSILKAVFFLVTKDHKLFYCTLLYFITLFIFTFICYIYNLQYLVIGEVVVFSPYSRQPYEDSFMCVPLCILYENNEIILKYMKYTLFEFHIYLKIYMKYILFLIYIYLLYLYL